METVSLRDGSSVVIRPIEPDDSERLREVWRGMSAISRRRRFLAASSVDDVSDEDLRYLVEVDHRRHEALLALDEDGHAVAVARYVRVPGDREAAELAVVVVDDWHRRGLATALIEALSARARENGIKRYTAIVSSDNEIVLGSLDSAGAERTGNTDEGEVELVFDVPSEDGIGDRLSDALRAAATAPWDFLSAGASRLAVWRRAG
jgi:RimJ/RimL family protein N-acetyltransferase